MLKLTKHGQLRARKRLGIPKKAVSRLAFKALKEGIPRSAFSGEIRDYLDKYYYPRSETASDLWIYKHNVFIFRDKVLMTTWPLPQKYRKQLKKHLISNKAKL